MSKIISFVPARCGSKSIPFKNVKYFCGKPLIYWSLSALQNVQKVDEIYVATDCDEIIRIVESFNFDKVSIYNRNKQNANDVASTESVMLEFIKNQKLLSDDIFVLVQATSPFTQSEDFERALKQYRNQKIDSLLSCAKIKRFFWSTQGKPLNYDFRNRPRRQDFSGQLIENGAFYINTVRNIVSERNRLSGNIGVFEMEEFTQLELDEEDDWVIGEYYMNKHILSKREKKKIQLFLTDVDGVLTDAGMYYSENGDELKKFNTKDGKGFELLRKAEIKTGIITSENTKIIENRAKKLKVDYLYQGATDKLSIAKDICQKENITLSEIAYIGDDINDLALLKQVDIKACPSDSSPEVKKIPNILVLTKKGGEGAVREFIEKILIENNLFNSTLERCINLFEQDV